MPEPTITEPATPAPGLYLVGEFLGVTTRSSKDGTKHNFVKILTEDAVIEAYLNADHLLEYAKKEVGEQLILPVTTNVRKDKRTNTFMDQVQYGVARTTK